MITLAMMWYAVARIGETETVEFPQMPIFLSFLVDLMAWSAVFVFAAGGL